MFYILKTQGGQVGPPIPNLRNKLLGYNILMNPWSNGKTFACHLRGQGSIPQDGFDFVEW